jgi:urease accessory protein
MDDDLALVRLLQLASPALPVGAYTYSQALENAVERRIVGSEKDAARWIGDALWFGIARWEAPAMAAMLRAWQSGDDEAVRRLDREFVASRESAELRAETLQMGHSLVRLLVELDAFGAVKGYCARLRAIEAPSYPAAWSAAAVAWAIPAARAVEAYLWSWLESQVMAAIKAVPLGQSAGQRLLADLGARIPGLARDALARDEASFCNLAPALAIASALHETQYTRLFRS